MKPNLLVRLAVTASVALARPVTAETSNFDQCLANLRKGPDSFIGYLCLGTPGLPDRPEQVLAALQHVLRSKPREPHARLYLALMRMYRSAEADLRDFTEPLAEFERNRAPVDLFLAQMAFVEKSCLYGSHVGNTCAEAGPVLQRANALAREIGNPDLIRLGAIARMRWSIQMLTYTEARRAEKDLDALPGQPPGWLGVLEVATRAWFASTIGEETRARDLYASLVTRTRAGAGDHAAALSGVAVATTRMALAGLADRHEAERLLRESIDAQKRLGIIGYNNNEVGLEVAQRLLALLLGRTPETLAFIAENGDDALTVELSLQGDAESRAQALRTIRAAADTEDPDRLSVAASWAHVELAVGSASDGMEWGDRLIRNLEERRQQESDDEIRMKGDSSYANYYHLYVSDLLDRSVSEPAHLERAWRVSEQLRARVLLGALLSRTGQSVARSEAIPDLEQVRAALRTDEALVSFMIWAPHPSSLEPMPYTRGHSYALVLTRIGLQAVRVAAGDVLEPAVRAWKGLVPEQRRSVSEGSRRLHDEVLRPVLAVLPRDIRSIVIVPDGPLHALAFDALSETGERPYLAERYAISIAPSASVWVRLRNRARIEPGLALAFANTPDGPAISVAETRGEIAPGQLGTLLHAREEAQQAVDAFPHGSRLLAGADATPEHLTADELARASLVHFAAHGVADSREPEQSFLLLAPGAGRSGVLKIADVRRFDWTGKTVVLSACESSVGAFRVGEGVLSLARGFFAGGASAVIGTLSRVRDEDQRALFDVFYSELRRGVSVGEAMAAAKRALIRSGAPPASWSNVVVMGDATVHPRARQDFPPRVIGLVVTASLAAATVLAVGIRSRRRRTPGHLPGPTSA